MAIKKINAVDNVANVLENKSIESDACVDIVTAAAYVEDAEASKKVEEIITDLDKKAEEIATESPDAPEVRTKSIYTDKLNLNEAVSDFKLSWDELRDDSEEDEYLDYDMFDFVYGIATDDWPKPKNPLGRRMRKFQHTDSDDYMNANEPTGMSQVAGDIDGNVVVYANDTNAFSDVREVCQYYHIECDPVQPRKSKDSHWAFNMKIHVPMTTDGYPMMVEDFFEQYGLTLSDVIEDHKVGGGKTANWGSTYEKRADKDRKEIEVYANDKEVEDTFDKYVKKAGNSNDPLEGFIKDMFAELQEKGLNFSKVKLKKRFLDEFNDDFDDED